jgi:hypothetical protein
MLTVVLKRIMSSTILWEGDPELIPTDTASQRALFEKDTSSLVWRNNNNHILSLVFDQETSRYYPGDMNIAPTSDNFLQLGQEGTSHPQLASTDSTDDTVSVLADQQKWTFKRLPSGTVVELTDLTGHLLHSFELEHLPSGLKVFSCHSKVFLLSDSLFFFEGYQLVKTRFGGIKELKCLNERLVGLDQRGLAHYTSQDRFWIYPGDFSHFAGFEMNSETALAILYNPIQGTIISFQDYNNGSYSNKRTLELMSENSFYQKSPAELWSNCLTLPIQRQARSPNPKAKNFHIGNALNIATTPAPVH